MAEKTVSLKIMLSIWTRYIAQDADGTWWECEEEPMADNEAWMKIGKCSVIAKGRPPKDFTKTIRFIG